MKPGTLFVVATPLGNLEDITLRALRVLREVDMIAAEDTRHSRKLLAHYGIATPVVSYYDQIERQKAPQLIAALTRGESVALISDAGTPGIADPGYHLVRGAIAHHVPVQPVPGPSAVAAALSVCGLPTDRFVFEGFLPARAAQRRACLARLAREARTVVAYEAARRLLATLHDLIDVLGDRPVVVVRELSKMFEETLRGSASDVLARLQERLGSRTLPGEVTLVIGAGVPPPAAPVETLSAAIQRLRAQGLSLSEVARVLSREHGVPRRDVYRVGVALAHTDEPD